ncbi:NAD(P)H-dependent oxidoreductase [Streptomyces sp. NPDC046805]|uniref:NAD(P)H-dependent oxidoreductase n=1 Tax=Streptomyces sp. NPDC046805 TaxID=3155134 RepID=UPI00340D7721
MWSSPTYHGSVSGASKNAVDWLALLADHDPPATDASPTRRSRTNCAASARRSRAALQSAALVRGAATPRSFLRRDGRTADRGMPAHFMLLCQGRRGCSFSAWGAEALSRRALRISTGNSRWRRWRERTTPSGSR